MTQPIAFTTAMLAWGLLQFPKGYGSSRTNVLQQVQVCAKNVENNAPINTCFLVPFLIGCQALVSSAHPRCICRLLQIMHPMRRHRPCQNTFASVGFQLCDSKQLRPARRWARSF